MGADEVIKDLESTIYEIAKRIKKRKNGPGADVISGLAKLTNSYTKLRQEIRMSDNNERLSGAEGYGDPSEYERMKRQF